jgi:ABC-type iron transport system FetAB ATPase subunit
MLRAMADLDEHKGGVLLQGREQSDQKVTDWRTQVAYLPAESAWWADTVGEHFKDAASIDWSVLGFEPSVQDWTVSRLSSGERQRLAMFRLLENKPRVLLLDEPTANLDAENTLLVEELVAEYVQRRQAAAVWVSHDQEQQKRLGARVIILGNHQEQNDD